MMMMKYFHALSQEARDLSWSQMPLLLYRTISPFTVPEMPYMQYLDAYPFRVKVPSHPVPSVPGHHGKRKVLPRK